MQRSVVTLTEYFLSDVTFIISSIGIYLLRATSIECKRLNKAQDATVDITRSPAIAEGPRDAGVPVEIW